MTAGVPKSFMRSKAIASPRGLSMDQHRDLGMGEYLDRLAAEDDRGDAVAAMTIRSQPFDAAVSMIAR
jgi:hypothetical protein